MYDTQLPALDVCFCLRLDNGNQVYHTSEWCMSHVTSLRSSYYPAYEYAESTLRFRTAIIPRNDSKVSLTDGATYNVLVSGTELNAGVHNSVLLMDHHNITLLQ